MSDPVVHPSHYTSHPSGVECIQVTKHHNFCIGSAIKYLWRQGLKDGNPAGQDLRKAMQYIQFEIDRIEGFPKHEAPEPESWATWQEVPNGVEFTSRDYPDRPTYRRHGSSVFRLDRSWVDLTRTKLDAIAPFVRVDS